MMVTIRREKITVQTDDPFLVFLVGMRVNKMTAFRKAYFVASSFIGMQKQLEAHPEKGCLWGQLFFRPMPFAATFISYWRSFDDLERFARGKDDIHLTAWQEFYKRVGMDGSIGIWHETYTIQPGNCEALYANMPAFGLNAALPDAVAPVSHESMARNRFRRSQQAKPLEQSAKIVEHIS